MKTLQQLLATMLLVLAIGLPIYAGDVSVPVGAPAPPPPPPPSSPNSVTIVISDPTDTPMVDADMPAWEMLAANLLWETLSMY